MDKSSPNLIESLVEHLSWLPSVGKKSAQRLAYFLLSNDASKVEQFAQTLLKARRSIRPCSRCGNFTELELCSICSNVRRNSELLCVVEKPYDILAFEKSSGFSGTYHVLGGCISPLDGIAPQDLNLNSLFTRVDNGARELILALNTTSEGEATVTYIRGKLQGKSVKLTRLARGIPIGSELNYVDELTMQRALEERVLLE